MRGSGGTKTYLAQTQTIQSAATVMLELNQNRYLTLNAVSDSIYAAGDTTPYFKNKFALEDVILPNRPPAGAVRPRYGSYHSTKVQRGSSMNGLEGFATYNSSGDYWVVNPRLYTVNTVPYYRYFSSQSHTGTFGVTYVSSVWANKIVIGLENTYEYPTTWTVQVKIAGSWVTIATNPAVDPAAKPTGRLEVYRVGGSWTTTAPSSPSLADSIQVEGIQLVISAMNSANSHINIIELSPRLVADVTQYLQGWSWDENLTEQDLLTPVGVISSGSGSVDFSNTGQDWESRVTGTDPRLAVLAVKHVVLTGYETINAQTIKMFTAYTDTWTVSEGDKASATLFDKATIAQGQDCPELLMKNVSVTAAMIRLLDQAGLSGYKIRRVSGQKETVMPYFFCNKSQTVWASLQALAKSHQYAIWVDADNEINIATKEWLYGRGSATPLWTFRADTQSPNLADIVSHEEAASEPINSVVINFKEQKRSSGPLNNDRLALTAGLKRGAVADVEFETRTLWDSNRRSVMLGCTDLTASINSSTTTIPVNVNTFRNDLWDIPVGYAYIDQEIIKIGAAEFGYTNQSGTYVKAKISNPEDWALALAEAVGSFTFSGRFVDCERGAFGSTPAAHYQVLTNWVRNSTNSKYAHLVANSATGASSVRLSRTNAPLDYKMCMTRNLGASYTRFFTRMMIPNQTTPQRAGGMVIWATESSGNLTGGWYVELRSSEKQTKELAIVQIKSTGALDRVNQRTFDVPVRENHTYDLAVYAVPKSQPGYTRLHVFVNSHLVARMDVKNSATPKTQKVALMATGRSIVEFDHFAAASGASTVDTYNAHVRSILSNVFSEKKSAVQGINIIFEGFDNKLRGVFEEDVTFDKAPILKVSMYPTINTTATNNSQTGTHIARSTDVIGVLDRSTPFSTRVLVANVASLPLALDDASAAIYPLLYGPIVEASSSIQVTAEDKAAQKKFGVKKLELSPEWIVTRKAAQDLATWLVSTKGNGLTIHTVTCFDNPLLEIGDIATISYPRKNMNADEKFIIFDISRSRDSGIATTVKLVKVG